MLEKAQSSLKGQSETRPLLTKVCQCPLRHQGGCFQMQLLRCSGDIFQVTEGVPQDDFGVQN